MCADHVSTHPFPSHGNTADHQPGHESKLTAWLRLTHTTGVGPMRGQRLLRHLGPPEEIFGTPAAQLHALLGRHAWVHALLADDPVREHAIDTALSWQSQRADRFILTLDDPRYPANLLHLADPPLLLYAEGDLGALTPAGVAIVGSRRATRDGLSNAFRFAQALSRRGLLIISGLAEGIDGAAHEGALAGRPDGRSSTIGALGSGIDRIYPRHHRALAARILESGGLLLSEQPPGTAPLKANFPRRNRMIAALSRSVLVVEAAMQSGSLITARLGAEIGRDVMAVPGSIHNPQSRGCHHLIRQGAALIECVDDILDCMGLSASPGPKPDTDHASAAQFAASTSNDPPNDRRQSRSHEPDKDPRTVSAPDNHPAADDQVAAGPGGKQAPDGFAHPVIAFATTPGNTGSIGHHGSDAAALWAVLGDHPLSTEALNDRLGWTIDRTLVTIQLLELHGRLSRHIDGRWQRQN
ncbi:MAG: DNA-processing protein DprA [Lautropia sp.]|nr:DNA-processing protein DprA [Lautropia sp.]